MARNMNLQGNKEYAKKKHNIFKYSIPLLYNVIDTGLTLLGQPSIYWQDYNKALEAAPHFLFLLKISPEAFLIGMFAWALIWFFLIRLTPTWVSLVAALTYGIGHAYGALTWLLFRFELNYFFLFLYFPIVAFAVILIVANEKWPNKKANSDSKASTRIGSNL